jgi:hypothetical protein
MKVEMAKSDTGVTFSRPTLMSSGATSESSSASDVGGATALSVCSLATSPMAHVWKGAVNGDTARVSSQAAHSFLNIAFGEGVPRCLQRALSEKRRGTGRSMPECLSTFH